MRRRLVGTGWKMNIGAAETLLYAETLLREIGPQPPACDVFVLPPFTSLPAAAAAFAGSWVAIGAQNMHWDRNGAWTGEISASMLVEAGCRYVELAHSERLAHFGETYQRVARKLDTALEHRLTPILCLGETAADKAAGDADVVLRQQIATALSGQTDRLPDVIMAYEPRWAIGATEAASPGYVAERHRAIRAVVAERYGAPAGSIVRILYGGSVDVRNGAALLDVPEVDGLFVGRAAWLPEGFAALIRLVSGSAP